VGGATAANCWPGTGATRENNQSSPVKPLRYPRDALWEGRILKKMIDHVLFYTIIENRNFNTKQIRTKNLPDKRRKGKNEKDSGGVAIVNCGALSFWLRQEKRGIQY
jgi:hypothetical protein